MSAREDELLALAAKLVKVPGPDQSMDGPIGFACGKPTLPAYTEDLGASMTLLPSKWKLRQMNFNAPCADDRKWNVCLYGGPVGQDTFVGRGATPAIAFAVAAMLAHAMMVSK